MKALYNWQKVFSFTLRQKIYAKPYRMTTLILAVILLIAIPAIMAVVEVSDRKEDVQAASPVDTVIVVDEAELGEAMVNSLTAAGRAKFAHITYITANSVEAAAADAGENALILDIRKSDGAYALHALRPEDSQLSQDDAEDFAAFANERFGYALFTQSGLSEAAMAELNVPTVTDDAFMREETEEIHSEDEGEYDPYAPVREVLSFAVPYLVIMVLYFLVLIYGQGVANSAIMEKTSKLMDTFLVTIRPAAMILGKVIAMVLSALIQLFTWIIAIVLGFIAGVCVVKAINPQTDMLLIAVLENLGAASGLFSLGNVIVSLLIIVAGFLLYCSLSAVGASLASKPEDLSGTNMLFSLALVASFLTAMYTGALYGDGGPVLNYIPFTAILIAPGRLLLGQMTMTEGLISLLIVLLSALALILLAGKMYTLISFWKGNPPSLKTAFGMLRKRAEK